MSGIWGGGRVPSDELHVNIGLDMPKQKGLNCVIGACMEDCDATGDNSDTDSVRGVRILGMTHAHGSFGVRLEIFHQD